MEESSPDGSKTLWEKRYCSLSLFSKDFSCRHVKNHGLFMKRLIWGENARIYLFFLYTETLLVRSIMNRDFFFFLFELSEGGLQTIKLHENIDRKEEILVARNEIFLLFTKCCFFLIVSINFSQFLPP